MKIFQSIAFRIWILFTLIGLCLSIPLALYYNNMQFNLLQQHTKKEFNQNAKITSNAVKTAIEMEDYYLLKNLLNDLENVDNFVCVAILEENADGTKNVFACNPKKYTNIVLKKDTLKYIYSSSKFSSEIMEGEIIIASSKARDILVLKELNRPLIYLTIIALVVSALLFGLSISFLSIPIFKSVEIARSLGAHDYNVEIKTRKGKDEISVLNNALYTLKTNLIKLDSENRSFMDSLEVKIDEITREIENKNKFNQILLNVSRIFLESMEEDKNKVVLETFQTISKSLKFKYMGIFDLSKGDISCQYNHDTCPLSLAFTENPLRSEIAETLLEEGKLQLILKNNQNNNVLIQRITKEIPEAEFIYLYRFKDDFQKKEMMILISEISAESPYLLELEDMIRVYHTVYSNFCRVKEFEYELKSLNKTLEKKVLEKTKINLEISNSLVTQEKLATIGELSAGIAHDLNTPLGAIKAASQNIQSILGEIFSQLKGISEEDLSFVYDFVQNSPLEVVQLNFFDKRKRAQAFIHILEIHNHTENIEELSKSFVDAGIDTDQISTIETVLKTDDPMTVLNLIKSLITMNSFVSIIDSSIERSSTVLSNLNFYTREDLTQKKVTIDLNHSIKIVESLFRFRLTGKINLITEVLIGSTISGIEMKLFQVWTNLVKNAIDSFDDFDRENKYIRIYSEITDTHVNIYFENNGPQIEQDDIEKIFKKFYTTKQKTSGTGLGLSIVMNIVSEHYGELSLTSDADKTIFSIAFPRI